MTCLPLVMFLVNGSVEPFGVQGPVTIEEQDLIYGGEHGDIKCQPQKSRRRV